MNYVSAVYGIVVAIITIDWFARGRKHYRGQTDRHKAAEARVGDQEKTTIVQHEVKL